MLQKTHTPQPGLNVQQQFEQLKSQFNDWRKTRQKQERIPAELKQAVIQLAVNGVRMGKFESMGVSHKQIKGWLNNKGSTQDEHHPPAFATVHLQPSEESCQPFTMIASPHAKLNQPIVLSIQHRDLQIQLSCQLTETAERIVKTVLERTHATTHTSS